MKEKVVVKENEEEALYGRVGDHSHIIEIEAIIEQIL